ncbi:MAG TPA: hypothetical protein VFJ57_02980 [Solirubrobacterales bacterium]|nr:hypothetical protein [Solirubrobacterales bacterium]
MYSRKAALGIAILAVLGLSALAASGATASGATTFTCVTDPSGTLIGDHCLTSGTGEKSKHVAIEPNTTTTSTLTNANTAEETKAAKSATLKATLAGVNTEITCSEIHGEGTVENRTTGEEMFGHGELKIHFTGCEVKAPAGKGCKVPEGTITTNQLTSRTVGSGATGKISPKEGTTFTEIKLEGCSIAFLNNTFPVTGSLEAKTNGATITLTHAEATTQNTLKFGGQKAGIEFAVTTKAHSKAGEETHPLSYTATP